MREKPGETAGERSRQKHFQIPAPNAHHWISHQVFSEFPMCWDLCFAVMYLMWSVWRMMKHTGRASDRRSVWEDPGQADPGARVEKEFLFLTVDEPELPCSVIIALDMVGEGARNMIQRGSSWSRHSIPLLPPQSTLSCSLSPPPSHWQTCLGTGATSWILTVPLSPCAWQSYFLFFTIQSLVYLPIIKNSECTHSCFFYWNVMS